MAHVNSRKVGQCPRCDRVGRVHVERHFAQQVAVAHAGLEGYEKKLVQDVINRSSVPLDAVSLSGQPRADVTIKVGGGRNLESSTESGSSGDMVDVVKNNMSREAPSSGGWQLPLCHIHQVAHVVVPVLSGRESPNVART